VSVSVVIPVRDGRRYLGEAIASIQAQTLAPLEILVVDDGSTDGSGELAAAAGATVIARAAEGPAAARNAGAQAARGALLAFLDADDVAAPERLELQVRALAAARDAAAVAGRMVQFLSPDRADELRGRFASPEEPVHSFTAGTLLLRREPFLAGGGLDTSVSGSEVIDWVQRRRSAGDTLVTIDAVVLRRRVHGDNLSRGDALHAAYLATARAAIARRRAGAGG
jgi:glycosyltransferase involved in cell wall biosynthesis